MVFPEGSLSCLLEGQGPEENQCTVQWCISCTIGRLSRTLQIGSWEPHRWFWEGFWLVSHPILCYILVLRRIIGKSLSFYKFPQPKERRMAWFLWLRLLTSKLAWMPWAHSYLLPGSLSRQRAVLLSTSFLRDVWVSKWPGSDHVLLMKVPLVYPVLGGPLNIWIVLWWYGMLDTTII